MTSLDLQADWRAFYSTSNLFQIYIEVLTFLFIIIIIIIVL